MEKEIVRQGFGNVGNTQLPLITLLLLKKV